MAVHTSLTADLPKLRKLTEWLTLAGYSEKIEGEYSLSLTKDPISVTLFYGRYSDLADVFVKIDDQKGERHANGEPRRYSVFEFVSVDGRQNLVDRNDGYETAKFGLDLLRNNAMFFEIDFLKDVRAKYLELSIRRLPKSLRNLS